MTTPTAYRFPYVGTDYKLRCPFDRLALEISRDGKWRCATGNHTWHRFGGRGAWKLLQGSVSR